MKIKKDRTKMTIQELSKTLGISVDAVRKRLQRGTIKGSKDKFGHWVIDDEDIKQDTNQDTKQDTTGSDRALFQSMQQQIDFLQGELQRKDAMLMSMINKPQVLEAPKVGILNKLFKKKSKVGANDI